MSLELKEHPAPAADPAPAAPAGYVREADVEAMVAKLFEAKAADILALGAGVQSATGISSAEGLLQTLAMEIARISDQGTNRKRVAPEVLLAREDARMRMFAKIDELHAAARVPAYRLVREVYLDEQRVMPTWIDRDHVQQPQEIDWPGVPNGAMRPINDAAREVFAEFEKWIDTKFTDPSAPVELRGQKGLMIKHRLDTRRSEEVLAAIHAGDQRPSDAHVGDGKLSTGMRVRGKMPGADQTRPVRVLGTVAEPAQERF